MVFDDVTVFFLGYAVAIIITWFIFGFDACTFTLLAALVLNYFLFASKLGLFAAIPHVLLTAVELFGIMMVAGALDSTIGRSIRRKKMLKEREEPLQDSTLHGGSHESTYEEIDKLGLFGNRGVYLGSFAGKRMF